MSTHEINPKARFQCRHILADGRRCRAACLRHQEFCYYHHASRKPVDDPIGRRSRRHAFTLPRIDDRASLQAALNDVVARIAANGIDSYRAGRLLYAIQLASCLLPRRLAAPPIEPAQEPGPLEHQVERVVHHPDYGEIAPRFELSRPPQCSGPVEGNREDAAPEARNTTEFANGTGDETDETDAGNASPQTTSTQPDGAQLTSSQFELQHQLESAREQLESREDRIHAMHAELARLREDLAKSQAQTAEAHADTLHAEKVMVWHMDRHSEARAELEALKPAAEIDPLDDPETESETSPETNPETLQTIQAVAATLPSEETCHLDRSAAGWRDPRIGSVSTPVAPCIARSSLETSGSSNKANLWVPHISILRCGRYTPIGPLFTNRSPSHPTGPLISHSTNSSF